MLYVFLFLYEFLSKDGVYCFSHMIPVTMEYVYFCPYLIVYQQRMCIFFLSDFLSTDYVYFFSI